MDIDYKKADRHLQITKDMDALVRMMANFMVTQHVTELAEQNADATGTQLHLEGQQQYRDDDRSIRVYTLSMRMWVGEEGTEAHKEVKGVRDVPLWLASPVDVISNLVGVAVRSLIEECSEGLGHVCKFTVSPGHMPSKVIHDTTKHYDMAIAREQKMHPRERFKECDCARCREKLALLDNVEKIEAYIPWISPDVQTILQAYVDLARMVLAEDNIMAEQVHPLLMTLSRGQVNVMDMIGDAIPLEDAVVDPISCLVLLSTFTGPIMELVRDAGPRVN